MELSLSSSLPAALALSQVGHSTKSNPVVGGVVLLVIVASIVFFVVRRHRRRKDSAGGTAGTGEKGGRFSGRFRRGGADADEVEEVDEDFSEAPPAGWGAGSEAPSAPAAPALPAEPLSPAATSAPASASAPVAAVPGGAGQWSQNPGNPQQWALFENGQWFQFEGTVGWHQHPGRPSYYYCFDGVKWSGPLEDPRVAPHANA